MARRTVEEHFSRMKKLSGLNEAKYSLIDGIDEDDELPQDVWKEPQPVSGADSNVHEDEEEPVENPEAEVAPEEELPAEEPQMDMPVDEPPVGDVSTDMPPQEPTEQEQTVDQLQNDMLKNALSAMLKMNDQLKNFEDIVNNLEMKISDMNKHVEEVKEPTNVEKLMSKKEDSHPYKLNLNDMWKDNWFQARNDNTESKTEYGIKQLEDGSFIADFDQLPKFTDEEIRDSFQ